MRRRGFVRAGRGLAAAWLLIALLLGACAGGAAVREDVRALLARAVLEDAHYPFMTALVESADGETLVAAAASRPKFFAAARAPRASDWMRIWSMSKLVTVVLALDLMEDGALRLGDPVARYLPELADLKVAVPAAGGSMAQASATRDAAACDYTLEAPARAITISDLMLHTAGFYYATTGLPCLDDAQAALALPAAASTEAWLAKLATLPLIQSPGEGYYYGLGTTVLGFVLERASGRSLQTLLEERITTPYEIAGLSFRLPMGATLPPRVSGADGVLRLARAGELDIFGGRQPPYGADTRLFLGGEGLVATAPGFAKFLRVVFFSDANGGPPLLTRASIEAMTTPHINQSEWGAMGYALWLGSGLRADGTFGRAGIWTGGGYEGTRYWIDPERKRVGVLMTQVFMPPARGVHIEEKIRDVLDAADVFDAARADE